MKLGVCAKTDIGRERKNNEDYYLVDPEKGLFIVADGMGGHKAGEVASRLAVEKAGEFFSEGYLAELKGFEDSSKCQEAFARAVREVVRAANKIVFETGRLNPECGGMGCTFTMALVDNFTLHLGHVGDTRAYLIRNGQIKYLTEDHSVVGEMVRAGWIGREEARLHPDRNQITRSIGIHSKVLADYYSVPLEPGDYVILCSDGLWDMLPDESIKQIVLKNEAPDKICPALITAANKAGGQDNITVIGLHME